MSIFKDLSIAVNINYVNYVRSLFYKSIGGKMTKKPGYMIGGSGFPIVFLHCSMSRKEQWFELYNSLKANHTVLSIDLHGYGDSPFPENISNFGLDNEIELINEVLDETIGLGSKFHLVAHSYGGAVAMKYSYMPGHNNISLSVYEPMLNHVFREIDPELFQASLEFISEIEKDIQNGDEGIGCVKFIDFFSGDGTFMSLPESMQAIFKECLKKMPLDYRSTIADDLKIENYKKIDVPVCLIAGDKSPDLTLRISEVMSQTLTEVEYHLIQGGHMAPIENPKPVNEIITAFIKKVS